MKVERIILTEDSQNWGQAIRYLNNQINNKISNSQQQKQIKTAFEKAVKEASGGRNFKDTKLPFNKLKDIANNLLNQYTNQNNTDIQDSQNSEENNQDNSEDENNQNKTKVTKQATENLSDIVPSLKKGDKLPLALALSNAGYSNLSGVSTNKYGEQIVNSGRINEFSAPLLLSFVNSFGVQNLSDKNDTFLKIFNSDNSKRVLTGKQPQLFPVVYNSIVDADNKLTIGNDYINSNNAIIYNPSLYNNTKDSRQRRQIITYDISHADERSSTNKAVDNSNYAYMLQGENKSDFEEFKDYVPNMSTSQLQEINKLTDAAIKKRQSKA